MTTVRKRAFFKSETALNAFGHQVEAKKKRLVLGGQMIYCRK